MSLNEEQLVSYGAIIDLILQHSDLNTVSAKKVRKELAERLGKDLTSCKDDINNLIGQRFDKFFSTTSPETAPESASGAINLNAQPAEVKSKPAIVNKPKPKPARHAETDAAMAARLQAEEAFRARPTRGGVVKKRAPSTKERKAAKARMNKTGKVKAGSGSDLSDLEDSEPKKRNGGFHRPMNLSPALATLLGETALSRPQTVKRIWEYIRAQNLQNPIDRRMILCDDALRAVFKTDRISMFTMNKLLSENLYEPEELF